MQQRQLVARCTQYGACAAAEQPIKMQHTRIHPLQAGVLRDARSALSLLFSLCQQGFSRLAASHSTCSKAIRSQAGEIGSELDERESKEKYFIPLFYIWPHLFSQILGTRENV